MQPNYPDIAGYELRGVLGTGGFASVYLARHVLLDRLVALKVMDPALARDREFCERFVREARDTARLGDHPNIVTIHDIGRVADVYYIAMQYLPGPNLKTLLDEEAHTGAPLDIIARVACALAHAHSQGFVHRDIKPANILFDDAGEAILSDFGIAKALGRETQLTAVGSIVGTARYMSPEQATRPDEIDHRSDLYSLGVVLYEMIAGAPPYATSDPMALMLAHVRDPVPELPPQVASCQPLIDRLMAKRPEDRYASAAELLDDLGRYTPSDVSCDPPARSGAADTTPDGVPGGASGGLPSGAPSAGVASSDAPRRARRAGANAERFADEAEATPIAAAPRSRRPLFAGGAALALVLVGGYVTTDPRVLEFISPTRSPAPVDAGAADDLAAREAPRTLPLVDETSPAAFVSSAESAGSAPAADGAIGGAIAPAATDGGASGAYTDQSGDAIAATDPARAGESAVDIALERGDDARAARGGGGDESDYESLTEAELQRLQRLLDVAELHELVGRISDPPGANAIEAYSLALALDPGNAVARGALARLQER